MHAHKDLSLLDSIPNLCWEAVEVEFHTDLEGFPAHMFIVHQSGLNKEIQGIIKKLREAMRMASQNKDFPIDRHSVFFMRPMGFGKTDVDLSRSHINPI